jgi:HK97 family phage major capsid protein
MEEQIQRAFDEYRSALYAEKELAEAIAQENRRPTPDEQEKFDRIEEDIESSKREYERLLKINDRQDELDEARASVERLIAKSDSDERQPKVKRDIEVLAEMFQRARRGETAIADGDDADNPFRVRTSTIESLQHRALGSSGGTAIDTTFVDRVLFYEVDESPMLDPANVTVFVTPRGEPREFPRLTADADTAGTLTAEAAGFTEADPTLSKVTFNAYKYGGITLWSAELDQDDVIAIQDVIARSAARHIVEQVNNPLTLGNGSNAPNGIINAALNGGTAAGTSITGGDNFFGWQDVVDLQFAVKPAYRRRGRYMTSTSALKKIRKFHDSDGRPLFQPPLAVGQPMTFNGYPIVENPDMAAAASASKSVLFGDTSLYWVRRAGSLRVEVSRDYKFNTDQIALKAVERIDGDLLDGNAVAYLVSANT